MRFMMIMIPAPMEDADWGPTPEAASAMSRYNDELTKAGVLLALDGLHPTSKGARVSFAGGRGTVTDGPFTEAKEIVGGYWLIQAKSKEEAVEWATSAAPRRRRATRSRCAQVCDMVDYSAEVQAAAS